MGIYKEEFDIKVIENNVNIIIEEIFLNIEKERFIYI